MIWASPHPSAPATLRPFRRSSPCLRLTPFEYARATQAFASISMGVLREDRDSSLSFAAQMLHYTLLAVASITRALTIVLAWSTASLLPKSTSIFTIGYCSWDL